MATAKEESRRRLLKRKYDKLGESYSRGQEEEKRLLAEIGETPESAEKEYQRLLKERDRIKGINVSDLGRGGLLPKSSSDKKDRWSLVRNQLTNSQYKKLKKKYGDRLDSKDYKKVLKYIKKHSGDSNNSTNMGKSKALNRNQLAALKIARPDVAAHKTYGKDANGLLAWWNKYGKQDSGLLGKIDSIVSGAAGGEDNLSKVSYDLENDPNYAALPEDLRKVAAYFENVGLASNTEQGTRLIQALNTAASQSDVYMKQFFRVAEDTMIRTADEYSAAFGDASTRLNKRVLEIQEDLSKNKEFLTLEEQSDLTRISNEYTANVEATQGTMAAAGLTQSKIRSTAEQRLAEQNKGLVEDTQRQYGKRISELETQASRGSTDARTQLDTLKRDLGYNITNLGRSTEQMIGSDRMPALTGYNPLGNISGKLTEDRTKDVMSRAGALLGESNLSSLNLNLWENLKI